MKGFIFNVLGSFIIESFGEETMEAIYGETEFASDIPPFIGPDSYPDEDLLTMVGALSRLSGIAVDDLVFDFGKFMFPVLARKFPMFLQGHETPIAFLAEVNDVIHVEVKKLFEDATPPEIQLERMSNGDALLNYRSPRKLCRLLEGLLEGVAAHFGQRVSHRHLQCMHHGHEACILEISFS